MKYYRLPTCSMQCTGIRIAWGSQQCFTSIIIRYSDMYVYKMGTMGHVQCNYMYMFVTVLFFIVASTNIYLFIFFKSVL